MVLMMSMAHVHSKPGRAGLMGLPIPPRRALCVFTIVLLAVLSCVLVLITSSVLPMTEISDASEEQIIVDSFVTVDSYSENLSASVLDAFKRLQVPAAKVSSAFIGGKKSGKGTYRFANGDVYSGQWKNGEMSGKGTYTFANKAKVKGTFRKNKFVSGIYRVTNKRGNYTFTIKKRKVTRAKIVLKNGFKYQGGYGKAYLSGKGKATYPSGDTYSGYFNSGKRSGTGTYVWRDGSKYKGKWANDLMNGKGCYFYSKNSSAAKLVGTFVDNHPSGTCTYYLKNGDRYKTSWGKGRCVGVL